MRLRVPATLLLSVLLLGGVAHAAPSDPEVQEAIRVLVSDPGEEGVLLGVDRIHAVKALTRFYAGRDHEPAWDPGLREELLGQILESARDGLEPSAYHLASLEDRMRRVEGSTRPDARQVAELDIVLTDSFLLLGSHLLSGRTNPVTIDSEWFADRREGDMVEVLETALAGEGVAAALEGLRPVEAEYARLRAHLARLRAIADRGGWPAVDDGEALEPGDTDPRVLQVRRRLARDADPDGDAMLYDPDLVQALTVFQERNGLRPDGVIGSRTRAALNVPVEVRIECLRVNLERWRWLPRDLGARHIRVNIAGFGLDVMENDHSVLSMKVITGRGYRRTPVFTGRLDRLVFSPSWDVPRKLAVQDKLPLIRKDPDYLAREGFQVFPADATTAIDPATIDWTGLGPGNFPYRLRQRPGPKNALGGVKFLFPNPFSVYLHDTSQRELFAETERALSSGCIRVEKPAELAAYLLQGRPEWTPESIAAAMTSGQEKTVILETPIPVHLLYWTAWQGEDGELQFRPDIYDRDRPLLEALREAPPNFE